MCIDTFSIILILICSTVQQNYIARSGTYIPSPVSCTFPFPRSTTLAVWSMQFRSELIHFANHQESKAKHERSKFDNFGSHHQWQGKQGPPHRHTSLNQLAFGAVLVFTCWARYFTIENGMRSSACCMHAGWQARPGPTHDRIRAVNLATGGWILMTRQGVGRDADSGPAWLRRKAWRNKGNPLVTERVCDGAFHSYRTFFVVVIQYVVGGVLPLLLNGWIPPVYTSSPLSNMLVKECKASTASIWRPGIRRWLAF
jgi:hypothetical protein